MFYKARPEISNKIHIAATFRQTSFARGPSCKNKPQQLQTISRQGPEDNHKIAKTNASENLT